MITKEKPRPRTTSGAGFTTSTGHQFTAVNQRRAVRDAELHRCKRCGYAISDPASLAVGLGGRCRQAIRRQAVAA